MPHLAVKQVPIADRIPKQQLPEEWLKQLSRLRAQGRSDAAEDLNSGPSDLIPRLLLHLANLCPFSAQIQLCLGNFCILPGAATKVRKNFISIHHFYGECYWFCWIVFFFLPSSSPEKFSLILMKFGRLIALSNRNSLASVSVTLTLPFKVKVTPKWQF